MSPEVQEFYRETLAEFREELAEADDPDERAALAAAIVTCELRLAGVP